MPILCLSHAFPPNMKGQAPAAPPTRTPLSWQAEEIMRTVLQRTTEALGESHPDSLVALSGLARLLTAQGRLEEAEEMMRKVRWIPSWLT
jgi:hypothetical protein